MRVGIGNDGVQGYYVEGRGQGMADQRIIVILE